MPDGCIAAITHIDEAGTVGAILGAVSSVSLVRTTMAECTYSLTVAAATVAYIKTSNHEYAFNE